MVLLLVLHRVQMCSPFSLSSFVFHPILICKVCAQLHVPTNQHRSNTCSAKSKIIPFSFISLVQREIYQTCASFGRVANGSRSVSSCRALLMRIKVSRFGMYCSRLSAIRLGENEKGEFANQKRIPTRYGYQQGRVFFI